MTLHAEKEHLALDLARTFTNASLHRSFTRWRARLGDHQQDRLRAVLVHEAIERKLVGTAFGTWRAASNRVMNDIATADKARAFFVSRQAMRVWRLRLLVKMREKMVERKRVEDLRMYFDAWRDRLAQCREDTVAIEQFQSTQDKRMLSRTLAQWTARVVEIKSREHDVKKERHRRLRREALTRWINASRRMKAAQELMQSFVQVRTEEQQRRVLIFWRDEAVRLRNIRETADRSIVEREDRILGAAFETWYDATRERRLKGIEEDVAIRREDGLMYNVWDKWKARSTRLPEISFMKKRMMRDAWSRWRDAMEMRDREKSIAEPIAQRVLLDVFEVWRQATRRKVALHATRIRRTRPSHGQASQGNNGHIVDRPSRRTSGSFPTSTSRSDRRVSMPAHGRPSRETDSVISEPAYSRLRSELHSRRRVASEEPEDTGQSELVRQLRGALR